MDDSQLRADLAQAKRAAQANGQALSEKVAELAYARPMADAAHAYCAAAIGDSRGKIDTHERARTHSELIAAHRATTPSQVPSSHVIVERAELERLRAIEKAFREYRSAHAGPEAAAAHDALLQVLYLSVGA